MDSLSWYADTRRWRGCLTTVKRRAVLVAAANWAGVWGDSASASRQYSPCSATQLLLVNTVNTWDTEVEAAFWTQQ